MRYLSNNTVYALIGLYVRRLALQQQDFGALSSKTPRIGSTPWA